MLTNDVYAEMFKFFKQWFWDNKKIPYSQVSKIVFTKYYEMATAAGFPTIESLTQEEKDSLVARAGQSRIRCKILYLIEKL